MTRVVTRPPTTQRGVEDRHLMAALRNHVSKRVGLTAEEFGVLDDHAMTIKLSDDIASTLCKQVSPDNPEAMKMFLHDFSRWVQRQKEEHKRTPVKRKR